MENNKISADSLLILIWKKKFLFIAIAAVTAVVSIITAYLIKEEYKAVASMYPTRQYSQPLGDRILPPHGIDLYGDEGECLRMIGVLTSAHVRNTTVKKFDLSKRYGLKDNDPLKRHYTNLMFAEKIRFDRNKYNAIDVVVWDRNPDTAKLIANFLCGMYDSCTNVMIANTARKNYNNIKKEYNKLQEEIKFTTDTIAGLRKLGVVGEKEEYAALLERQTIAQQKGGAYEEKVNKQIENNDKYGGVLFAYTQKLGFLMKRNEILKGNLDQVAADMDAKLSYHFLVDAAETPQKKAYPIRWLIVAVSTIASLFFTLILLVVLIKVKQLKAKM